MQKCNQCQSSDIKSRTTHSHGKKSRSRTTLTCNNCGSKDIEAVQKFNGRRKEV